MNFAERIKDLRKSRGLDQAQMGAVIGISGPAVSKWETGKSEPDIKVLVFLCDYFKISADYLLGRTEYKDFVWRDETGLTKEELEDVAAQVYTKTEEEPQELSPEEVAQLRAMLNEWKRTGKKAASG